MIEPGYYQCTAFNGGGGAYSAIGRTLDEAAYSALYDCGGPSYEAQGCFIPDGYCRLR